MEKILKNKNKVLEILNLKYDSHVSNLILDKILLGQQIDPDIINYIEENLKIQNNTIKENLPEIKKIISLLKSIKFNDEFIYIIKDEKLILIPKKLINED